MLLNSSPRQRLNWRERLAAVLVVLGLALPFVPVPGDGVARMNIAHRSETALKSAQFTTQAPLSVCMVLAYSLDYENPETGGYTHIACN